MSKRQRRAWGQIRKYINRQGQTQYQALSPRNQKPIQSKLCQTRKEAEAALAAMQTGLFQSDRQRSDETQSNPSQTIDSTCPLQTVLQDLLTNPRRPRSTKTKRLYQGFLDLYVAPTIGHIPTGEVTYHHIQQLLSSLESRDPKLSGFTVNAIRAYLRAEMNELFRSRFIMSNPVPQTSPSPTPPKKIVYWTREEISLMIAAAPHQEARTVLSIACFLGLRAGEISGLQMKDLDLSAKTLNIVRAVRWHKGGFELYPCKKHSQRLIPLAGDAGEMVMENIELHLATLDPLDPDHFLFGQSPTRPRHETTFNTWHHKAIVRANEILTRDHGTKPGNPKQIKHGKLHGTRSTTITELRRQGVHMETIQVLVGHRDQRTTQENYLLVDESDIREALTKTTRKAK